MIHQPALEKVNPTFGSSFTVKVFHEHCQNQTPTWHFHPEYELVYVKEGSGKRHIGNHMSYFHNGDFIIIGSNLPHYGFAGRLVGNNTEIVVQMKIDFLGPGFFDIPEMVKIKHLLERSKMGLVFSDRVKHAFGARLELISKLDPYDRLLEFLSILRLMSETEEYKLLNAQGYTIDVKPQDSKKINDIFQFVKANFTESITLEEVAMLANMTTPSFCRFFKKQTGKTFTHFVNEFRIIHACKLLTESTLGITSISYEVGFNNFSYFNKTFKLKTGQSPSSYRKSFRQIVTA